MGKQFLQCCQSEEQNGASTTRTGHPEKIPETRAGRPRLAVQRIRRQDKTKGNAGHVSVVQEFTRHETVILVPRNPVNARRSSSALTCAPALKEKRPAAGHWHAARECIFEAKVRGQRRRAAPAAPSRGAWNASATVTSSPEMSASSRPPGRTALILPAPRPKVPNIHACLKSL